LRYSFSICGKIKKINSPRPICKHQAPYFLDQPGSDCDISIWAESPSSLFLWKIQETYFPRHIFIGTISIEKVRKKLSPGTQKIQENSALSSSRFGAEKISEDEGQRIQKREN
jgi:hypothetical protein